MIGMLKGIMGAKGNTLKNSLTGITIDGNTIQFWDKFKRKNFYYLKIFWGETHNEGLHKYT